MLSILAALLGFLQAMLPEGLKFMQDKRDKEHELAVMTLQMTMQEKGLTSHLEEIQIQGRQAEVVALQQSYRADLKYSGKYSASVRPTVTYMAMALYVTQKILFIWSVIFLPALPWLPHDSQVNQVAMLIWTAFDETLLSWIIGFWFGSRTIEKAK